jgi:hypothetical protein
MDNTQLTHVSDYDVNNIIFSKPVVNNIAGSAQMTYKRISISTKNKDGSQGDLVLATERLFSFGVSTRNPEGDPKDGYQLSLSMYNRDNPTPNELAWVECFDKIIDKCKDEIVRVKDQLALYDLRRDDSILKSCTPLKYKKDKGKIVEGVPPILGVKLLTRKGDIVSMFHDERGNKIDPMTLEKRHCHVIAAIKVESIFIGSKLIAIQLKLYEAQVKLVSNALRPLLAPAIQNESGSLLAQANVSPFDDDDYIE